MTHNKNTVLVTGAFGGIGKAICSALSLQGHEVIRVARRLSDGDNTDPPPPGVNLDIQADLASVTGWEHVLDTVRNHKIRIDSLIHSAGTLLQCDISTVDEDDLRKMIDDNILSVMFGCRALVPLMKAAHHGHIIILGSLGGIIPMPHDAVYSAAKFAVRGFTLSIAEELRGSGIIVSLVSCGPVCTPMLRRESRHSGTIGFFNTPLSPRKVANTIMSVMNKPRRETVVPGSSAIISPIVGGFSWLFRGVYPLVSAVGRRRKIKFISGVQSGQPIISRSQS